MPVRVFSIPCHDDGSGAEAVNQFTASVRVNTIERRLIEDGQRSFWAICIDYTSGAQSRPVKLGRERIDYREVLPEAEFAVYAKLRGLRKQLAERDGVPAYTLFTNDQLAAMIQRRVSTPEALRRVVERQRHELPVGLPERQRSGRPQRQYRVPLRPSSRPDGGAGPEQTRVPAIPSGLAKAKGRRRAGRIGRSPSEGSPADHSRWGYCRRQMAGETPTLLTGCVAAPGPRASRPRHPSATHP